MKPSEYFCTYSPPHPHPRHTQTFTLTFRPSRACTFHVVGFVAVYVFDINLSSVPTPFCSVLVSITVFMALSNVFHSINSTNNSLLSHSVLPVFFALLVFSSVYLSMKVFFNPDIILCS